MFADRIIDIDSQLYSAGWYADKTRTGANGAIEWMERKLDAIREATPANGEYLLIKGENKRENFRYEIYPDYKANRKPGEAHYNAELREWLFREQYAIDITTLYPDLETDDVVGMFHKPTMDVIVAIDKDLRQYPGAYYNPDKNETDIITPMRAARSFWIQVIAGDSGDNVKGIPKLGVVLAAVALAGCRHFATMEETARAKYVEFAGEEKADRVMAREAMLVWMARPWAMRWEPGLATKWYENYDK